MMSKYDTVPVENEGRAVGGGNAGSKKKKELRRARPPCDLGLSL